LCSAEGIVINQWEVLKINGKLILTILSPIAAPIQVEHTAFFFCV